MVVLVGLFILTALNFYTFDDPNAQRLNAVDASFFGDMLTKIPRNSEYLLGIIGFLVALIGPGDVLLKPLRMNWADEFERGFCALITGLAMFTFAVLGLGSLGLLQRKVFGPLLLVGLLLTARYGWLLYKRQAVRLTQMWRNRRAVRQLARWKIWTGGALLAGLVVYGYMALLGALGPETGFDARWYHLGPPVHYADKERVYNIMTETRLGAAALPPYQEMLFSGLIKVFGTTAAKLMHWADGILIVILLVYMGRVHLRSLGLGLLAGLIFLSTPVISWSMGTSSNDLALALYTLLMVHLFLGWIKQPSTGRLVLLGSVIGYAAGVKPFTAFGAVILLGSLIVFRLWPTYRQQGWPTILRQIVGQVLLVGGVALLFALPWLIRSYAITGNPVFPFLNGFFKSPYWGKSAEMEVSQVYQVGKPAQSLWEFLVLPWSLIANNDIYRVDIGPQYLVCLPALIVAVSRGWAKAVRPLAVARWLCFFVVSWAVIWFLSGATSGRYLQGIIPVLALVTAYGIVRGDWRGWAGRILQTVLVGLTVVITLLNHQLLVPFHASGTVVSVPSRTYIAWPYLYDNMSERDFLLTQSPMTNFINENLSATTDKVYDFSQLIHFYSYSKIEIFNGRGYDGPEGLDQWDIGSPDVLQHLKQEHITYLTMLEAELPNIQLLPLWTHLEGVTRTAGPYGNEVLFRVNY